MSAILYSRRFAANLFFLATSPLWITASNFMFHLNASGYSPYVTSSPTRGWVCRLKFLLPSPAQSFSSPSPARLMTTFYFPRFETHPAWRASSRIYILQEQDGLVIPPTPSFPYRRLLWLAGLRWKYSTPPPHGRTTHVKSQGPSYVTTDSQSASLSWNKGPVWGLRPDLY
jgi:hypothetical protein